MRKTVMITGAAGFLGSHLARRLLADDCYVIGVDDFSTGRQAVVDDLHAQYGSQFRFHRANAARGLPPAPENLAAVCHLASPASPKHYQLLPVRTLMAGSVGTMNALQLARKHAARFLFTSTSEVYGDPAVHPQSESYHGNVDPVGPRSMYDEAKRFSEALTVAYAHEHQDVSTCIARLFNTYGPGMALDDSRVVPQFITQALADKPVTVHGDGAQTRSLCYVDDTISALVALLWSQHCGPVNIGNPAEISIRELAVTIRGLCGSSSTITHTDRPDGDPQRRCPDISLINWLTGWEPWTPLADGLLATIDYFRAVLAADSSDAAKAAAEAGGDGAV